ncbi:acetate--CoA ligase family protein, partial [Burkholderia sp. SIMBA_024]|uniref:acetate--CoA ligase family protein n=1 Tax=Burkholderia sp. SIMBA_024 TaxID=3085768 RepID=UPI003978DB29
AYGIPISDTRIAEDADSAVKAAEEIGFPVALKVISKEITHKSEVGGVELELENADDVRAAAERIQRRVGKKRPDATIE